MWPKTSWAWPKKSRAWPKIFWPPAPCLWPIWPPTHGIVLITLLGSEGLKVYDTCVYATPGDDKKIKPVLDKFSAHFKPRRSECFERFKFLKRHQCSDESFDSWLVELRSLVKNCNYGTQVGSILRDQLVIGVSNSNTREKLLYEKDLDLNKAVEIRRACEATRAQLDHMKLDEAPSAVVHTLSRAPHPVLYEEDQWQLSAQPQ